MAPPPPRSSSSSFKQLQLQLQIQAQPCSSSGSGMQRQQHGQPQQIASGSDPQSAHFPLSGLLSRDPRRLKNMACVREKAAALRRLGSVAAHLVQLAPNKFIASRPAAPSSALSDSVALSQLPDARASGLYREPWLLTNQQMADFLGQGFLSLEVDDVPAEVHSALHQNAERIWEQSSRATGAGLLNPGATLGNNIWPAVPQLGQVLRSSVVHGGLQSILGSGYVMNAHRHMHNSSTQGDQTCKFRHTRARGAQTAHRNLNRDTAAHSSQGHKQQGRVHAPTATCYHILCAGRGDSPHGADSGHQRGASHVGRRSRLDVSGGFH